MIQTFAQSKAMHDAGWKDVMGDSALKESNFEDVTNSQTFEDCYRHLLTYLSISYVPEEKAKANILRYKDVLALIKYMNKPGITIDEAKHKTLYKAAYQNFINENLIEA